MRDVWRLPAIAPWEKSCGKHPTQKPLCVLSRIIQASTKPGAWVLDPFTGGSTTGIAANLLDRRFLGIDTCEKFLELSKVRREEINNISVRMIILFPFFAVKNGHNFAKSILGQMFACRKDMFYRFLANADINWRQNALLSTNTALGAYEAYKIYSMRWAIEVSFAEAFNFDQDEMMRAIINNNNKELNAVRRAFEALQLAA